MDATLDPANMVVLCLGAKPVNELAAIFATPGTRGAVVGDALQPRKVTEAVTEGALAVLDLLNVSIDAELRQEISHGRRAPALEVVSSHELVSA